MEFRILGPLVVHDDEGRPIEVGAGRPRALLAALILHANEVVASDRLIDDLWGERPPRTAAKALQGYVSQIRRVLDRPGGGDGTILTRAPGYMLRLTRPRSTPTASKSCSAREGDRCRRARRSAPPQRCGKRSTSGEGRPWRSSGSRSSHSARSPA